MNIMNKYLSETSNTFYLTFLDEDTTLGMIGRCRILYVCQGSEYSSGFSIQAFL